MKITFNQVGIIVNTELDDTYRQGSVGNKLTAKFIDKLNTNYIAKINITRPDGSILDNLLMNPSLENNDKFEYTFNDEWYLAIPGTATLTIYLFDANQNVQAQGQVSFNIESSDYTDEPTYPTEEQYNSLLSQVIAKLEKGNKNWVRANDDFVEKATSGLLPKLEYVKDAYVFVHDDENEQSLIYQITAVSDNPNNENYVSATYRLLLTFADGLWTLEQIIARVEEVCYTKTQTDNFLSEKANTVYVDTNFGNSIEMRVDSDYKIYLSLINKNGQQIGETQVIDLPLESVVVSGYYDSDTKEVVLTLKDGSTIRFSVADLVSGLQTEITPTNKLSADLVDDADATNKFVTSADKANWNGKQDALVSGTNIKTINNESILGSGNIDIQTDYQEGFGIDITDDTISVDTDVITTKKEFNALKLLVEEAIIDTSDYQINYWDIDNVPITINSYPTLVSAGLDIKALRGRSVAFNQLVNYTSISTETKNGITLTNNNDGSFTLTGTADADTTFTFLSGTWQLKHHYLIKGLEGHGLNNQIYWIDNYYSQFSSYIDFIYTPTNSSYAQRRIALMIKSGNQVNFTIRPQVFDLSFMNLSSITSVEEFNKLFPEPYYEYNAGTLLSSKASALDVVGYNCYDNANPSDYIKVIAGQAYTLVGNGTVALYDYDKNLLSNTFTSGSALPNNCHFVKISSGDANTIFHLTSTDAKIISDVYGKQTYALPNVELKGVGTAYDELKPDGKLIPRISSYTFTGNESFLDWQGDGVSLTIPITGIKQISDQHQVANIKWALGISLSYYQMFYQTANEYDICLGTNNNRLYIKTTKTSAQLASALVGKTVYFELATPTETQTEYTFIDSIESLQDGATLSQTSSVGLGYVIDTEMAIYKPKGE